MQPSFLHQTSSYLIASVLVLFILFFYGVGHYFKRRRFAKDPSLSDDGLGPIEGSLLGLLALLLSFTFSVASTRYDTRVQVMMHEANNIRTAITLTDIFPDSLRNTFRSELATYVDARVALYDAGINIEKNNTAYRQTEQAARQLRQLLRQQVQSNDPQLRDKANTLYPALNAVFDSATARKVSREVTIPESVLWLLLLLCLTASFIVGYGGKKKIDWILITGFSLMLAITVFAIIDLDRPHRGLNKLDTAEKHILELKELLRE